MDETMEYNPHFNAFDLLLLVTIGFSMIIGLSRGFIREFLGVCAWAGALALAMQGYTWPRILFEGWISEPSIVTVASQFFVFCTSLIIFLLVAQWASHWVHNTIAQSVDRSLGLVFGFVRGISIICALYTGSLFFVLPHAQPAIVKLSKSHTWLTKSVFFLQKALPPFLREKEPFQKSLKEIQGLLPNTQELTKELSSPPVSQD